MPTATDGLTAGLVEQALKLPPAGRETLGLLLLDSLDPGIDDPAAVRRAWTDEITRRVEAFERGETNATDWRESLARVEAQFRERHP